MYLFGAAFGRSRLTLLLSLALLASCNPHQKCQFTDSEIKKIARDLDSVARDLEEWGTLSASGPLITSDSAYFKFDLERTGKELYDENRLEGAVSLRLSEATDFRASVRVEQVAGDIGANLAAMKATNNPLVQQNLRGQIVAGMRELAGSPEGQAAIAGLVSGRPELVGMLNAIVGTTQGEQRTADETDEEGEGETDNENADDSEAENEGEDDDEETPKDTGPKLVEAPDLAPGEARKAVGDFSAPLGTFDSTKLGTSPRRKIRLAASDKFELGLHKLFSNPPSADKNWGQEVLYCAFSVACQPGWRTREGFIGNVDVQVRYAYDGKHAIIKKFLSEKHPVVSAVYPAFDSQELNLRNSYRQLVTIAAQLATAGQGVGSKVFLEAARKLEQDSETNTGISIVSSYSHGGRNFGYEFRPAFRAIKQPGALLAKKQAGFWLDSVSFPAVAVMVINKKDMEDLVVKIIAEQEAPGRARAIASEQDRVQPNATDSLQAIKEVVNKQVLSTLIEQKGVRGDGQPFLDEVEQAAKPLVDEKVKKLLDEEMANIRIEYEISHNWRPIEAPAFAKVKPMKWFGRLFEERLGEQSMAERLMNLRDAYACNEENNLLTADHDLLAYRYLSKRWRMLEAQGLNLETQFSYRPFRLPEAKKPAGGIRIDDLMPSQGYLGQDSIFVIKGSELRAKDDANNELTVSLSGMTLRKDYDFTRLSDTAIAVVVRKNAYSIPTNGLSFKVSLGNQSTYTPPFSMVADFPQTTSSIDVTVQRNNAGEIESITVPNDDGVLTPEDYKRVQDLIQAFQRCCPDGTPGSGGSKADVEIKVKAEKDP